MQLTSYTDYSLRTLLYLAQHQERLVTISEISDHHGISRNHLVKVVHNLGKHGFIQTVRGKSGGVRLAHEPEKIILADVVWLTEPHMNIQECFSEATNTCSLMGSCKLAGLLYQARHGFMKILQENTLADIL
ncbi:MAG: Rrf2 family transcriptional regulator [Mariprofundaceae bacterium]|nr:Rrf2 family transcriptional regulator [Mariprofundaceae bacterium]